MTLPAIIGIHIGQGHNYTAVAEVSFNGLSYTIFDITRLPLEFSYPEIEDYLIRRLKILTMDGDHEVKIRINATGIGRPVTNFMRKKITVIEDVYLTGGYKAEKIEEDLMLPKDLMISHLKVLFLIDQVSSSFEKPKPFMTKPDKQRFELLMVLKKEVLDYETKVHVDGAHWNPDDRTGDHDDLVIALGLACWLSQ